MGDTTRSSNRAQARHAVQQDRDSLPQAGLRQDSSPRRWSWPEYLSPDRIRTTLAETAVGRTLTGLMDLADSDLQRGLVTSFLTGCPVRNVIPYSDTGSPSREIRLNPRQVGPAVERGGESSGASGSGETGCRSTPRGWRSRSPIPQWLRRCPRAG